MRCPARINHVGVPVRGDDGVFEEDAGERGAGGGGEDRSRRAQLACGGGGGGGEVSEKTKTSENPAVSSRAR